MRLTSQHFFIDSCHCHILILFVSTVLLLHLPHLLIFFYPLFGCYFCSPSFILYSLYFYPFFLLALYRFASVIDLYLILPFYSIFLFLFIPFQPVFCFIIYSSLCAIFFNISFALLYFSILVFRLFILQSNNFNSSYQTFNVFLTDVPVPER
jgi:hypothetical protein